MNRVKTMVIVLCVAELFCAAALCAQSGVIRELSGTVEIKRAGQTAFVPAKAGDAIAADTIISTGLKSTALVAAGSAVITVRPLTRLSFAEISSTAGSETINVALQSGRVRVDVNPPAGTRSDTTVRGPNATASVRGTSFEFDTKTVKVFEGRVAFSTNRGRTVLVNAGSSSQVTEKEKPANPLETTAAELLPLPPAGTGSGKGHRRDPSAAAAAEFSFSITFFK
jgi:hypothetical protein